MKKYIYGLFLVLAICCMSSCGDSSEITSTNTEHETNYRFVVNVTKGNEDGTRTTDKTSWVKGDVIYVITDEKCDFTLTYQGEDYWQVDGRSWTFSEHGGKLHAYYGLGKRSPYWIVYPEQFLYTDEGTYTKEQGTYIVSDDIIYINLDMNKRPYARLTVKGIDKGYAIANMETQQTLTDLWDMTFKDTLTSAAATDYDEQTQTATYYGIVSPTDNKTHILLYNADGVGYSRTYDKVMTGGETIVLNGPNSSESSSWTKHTLVKSITLNKNSIYTYVDESHDLVATIYPVDADNDKLKWSTSNANVATVDENGHVNVNGVGNAIITVQTEDGTKKANCAISAGHHIGLSYSELVYNQGNGQIKISVYNYYDKPVDLKQIYLKNANTGKTYLEYNITDGRIDDTYTTDTSNFSGMPSGTYILGANYICNNKEYTAQREIEIK